MKHFFFLFLISFSLTINAQGSFFANVQGDWKGTGTLFQKPAEYTMSWDYVLDSSFVRLQFTNMIVGGGWTFEAQGFYPMSSKGNGTWVDNRGVTQSLDIDVTENELTVIWESSTEKGKTVYSINTDGTLSVLDFVFKNDNWKQFGEAKYVRSE